MGQGLVGLLKAEDNSPSDHPSPHTAIEQVRLQPSDVPLTAKLFSSIKIIFFFVY